jgi:ATP-dependent Clp endopeptidase proteolytic subunit ClpP
MSWYEIKNATDDAADLFIYDVIGEDWWTGGGVTAKQFAKDMQALKTATINLHLNSPGGNVWDGQAIYNALIGHPAKVTTFVDGLAASIASVVAMAGDRIVMAENALMMIHDPWAATTGTAGDMRKMADTLDKVKDTIVGVYARRTGLHEDSVSELMTAETWYTADEAVTAGFADEAGAAMKLAACFDV